MGVDLEPCRASDVEALTVFLREADLTLSGLDAPSVRLWLGRDERSEVVCCTGYEISADGQHALIRSVAVSPSRRSLGMGSALARFAFERAIAEGARTAWLFSRRSGPFWQTLGFEPANRDELAEVFADTHQVRMFRQTGQLAREVAWSRPLVRDGSLIRWLGEPYSDEVVGHSVHIDPVLVARDGARGLPVRADPECGVETCSVSGVSE